MNKKEMIEITKKAVRKNEDNTGAMLDLLNQEQAELQKSMIEEMARAICSYCNDGIATCKKKPCSLAIEEATAVFYLGYRKIPDGGCVLNKEENENFVKFVLKEKDKTRKETAKEIIKDFSLTPRTRAMIMNKYGLTKEDFEK